MTPQRDWQLDGVNLLPFLTGTASGSPHETLYWRLGEHMAIRMGDWKLVKTHEGALGGDPGVLSDLSGAELFNLAEDISEARNLVASNPAKARELSQGWQRWNRQLATPLWRGGRGGGDGR